MTDVQETEVLILGGGINGCGVFRDLCVQGVSCLLLERNDFCAGASAASSRLMHGGLKYLETGEFRLVRESAEERNRLLRNAPHYVSPLPSLVPVRSRFGGLWAAAARFVGADAKMNDRGGLILGLGLILYDLYGRRFRAMPRHRMLGRKRLDALVAGLSGEIIGAGLYYEGQISHAERLGLELLLDGEEMHPRSRALNHAEIQRVEGGVISFMQGGSVHRVKPKVIVNAGGAWIDEVNDVLGIPSRLMGGSKGAHLVVENPKLLKALNGHMIYFGTADGRVNLLYPFMGRVLIGSTDHRIEHPDDAICSDEEAEYLCAVVGEIFPGIPVTPSQIRHRFSGVRPLPRADGDIGMVTRDHSIVELELGSGTPVLCLIGGKWTTFRGFSEQAADRLLDLLGKRRVRKTDEMQIGGGRDYPRGDARETWIGERAENCSLTPARIGALLSRYGTRLDRILPQLRGGETPLVHLPGYSREELEWLCRNERVVTLADLLQRRTAIAISGDLTPEVACEVAEIPARVFEWDAARKRAEIDALSLSSAGEPMTSEKEASRHSG
ncbi:glycerol-3-phosphate dehydrogenase/oxidase [Paracoccus alkanivorans]|uniref:Glycerol-3-phosphate dehydrogenase/oxidase n=1 Tax=Paracoccus alkanivorans TaxID=2116655 RepID=A0A3M0MJM2_9RHOB|nr:glycerol-3-phosphate dehydrogenase/oxidase [Paracoccus alkanivorans]RMC37956.1 glycerol-3-phosphate dehydrogenase/oxidase [Paracoccus alkanivorans]